jgi:hypothetical protein
MQRRKKVQKLLKNFDIISSSQKHTSKNLIRPSSLSFSLSSDEEEEEDTEERGGSIRFVSDLLFFPLVLVIGRV